MATEVTLKKLRRKLRDFKLLKKQAMQLYEENEKLKLENQLLKFRLGGEF